MPHSPSLSSVEDLSQGHRGHSHIQGQGHDLASIDEMTIYKDEGGSIEDYHDDCRHGDYSLNELDEEKFGLLTETEQVML